MPDSKIPSIAERYGLATVSKNLKLDQNKRGAVNMLIASGLALRFGKNKKEKFSRILGKALTRLEAEWHQAAKPKKMQIPTIKDCVKRLPLIKVGERLNVPVMGRNKIDARKFQEEQKLIAELSYSRELVFLAQKLPSRIEVKQILFELVSNWTKENKDELMASIIVYWLTNKCLSCNGTGLIKLKICNDCKGSSRSQCPGFEEGRSILNFMDQSQRVWADSLKSFYRSIHKN